MENKTDHQTSWTHTSLYPFDHHYASLENGTMHYVDEGDGEVLLFVHGTPTWSFLWREFIKAFSATHRCIAVDHLGFGLSKITKLGDYTPQWHTANLTEFIKKLDLHDITIVVHDFGGPIGLSSALAMPERIKQVVLFNTWLWETKHNPQAQKIDKLVNSWLGEMLYLRFNASPKLLLKKGFNDKAKLTKELHQHYLKPFPDKDSRVPLLDLAKGLVGSSDWYADQWSQMEKLTDKKWLILWGIEDDFITSAYLEKWQSLLPTAQVEKLPCGHFVQEEDASRAIQFMRKFLT